MGPGCFPPPAPCTCSSGVSMAVARRAALMWVCIWLPSQGQGPCHHLSRLCLPIIPRVKCCEQTRAQGLPHPLLGVLGAVQGPAFPLRRFMLLWAIAPVGRASLCVSWKSRAALPGTPSTRCASAVPQHGPKGSSCVWANPRLLCHCHSCQPTGL